MAIASHATLLSRFCEPVHFESRKRKILHPFQRKRPAAPFSTASRRMQGALELDLETDGGFELGQVGFVFSLLLAVGPDAVGVTYLLANGDHRVIVCATRQNLRENIF